MTSHMTSPQPMTLIHSPTWQTLRQREVNNYCIAFLMLQVCEIMLFDFALRYKWHDFFNMKGCGTNSSICPLLKRENHFWRWLPASRFTEVFHQSQCRQLCTFLFTQYFLKHFTNGYQNWTYGDLVGILDVSTFGNCNLNNKVNKRLLCINIGFVCTIFPNAFHQCRPDLEICMWWTWVESRV